MFFQPHFRCFIAFHGVQKTVEQANPAGLQRQQFHGSQRQPTSCQWLRKMVSLTLQRVNGDLANLNISPNNEFFWFRGSQEIQLSTERIVFFSSADVGACAWWGIGLQLSTIPTSKQIIKNGKPKSMSTNWRKFRSQTSDNVDRWKAEMGRVREEKTRQEKRREEKKEDQKRESLRRKIQVREKVGKSRNSVFPMICGSGGPKSRLAKAAGAEPAGQMRDEKLYAVVARSTFPSQNVQSTPSSDHFWKVRWWKSARRCGAKHISKSKCTKHTKFGPLLESEMMKSARRCGAKHISKSECTKHTRFGPLLEIEMMKKCTPLWREAHFEVKSVKGWRVRNTFGRSDVVSRGRRKGLCSLSRVSKTWGFCSISKNDGRRGTFEEDLARFIFRGTVQETRSSEMLAGPGADFLRRVAFWSIRLKFWEDDFAWQVQHFAWPGITFLWQAQHFRQVEWKKRKTHWYEAISSALNFPFLKDVLQNCLFLMLSTSKLRKSHKLVSFLMLSNLKIEEVSQNCFVFDVVKFKNLGSLAE